MISADDVNRNDIPTQLEHVIQRISAIETHNQLINHVATTDGSKAITSAQFSARTPNANPDKARQVIRFRATIENERCSPWCPCSCHLKTGIQSPRWLRHIIGQLFYTYVGTSLLYRRPCDFPKCLRSGSPSNRISYHLPAWALPRVLSFTSSWKDLNGQGATWTLRIPRVINMTESSRTSRIVQSGDVAALKVLVQNRQCYPLDVFFQGDSLLSVSFAWSALNCSVSLPSLPSY